MTCSLFPTRQLCNCVYNDGDIYTREEKNMHKEVLTKLIKHVLKAGIYVNQLFN